MTPHEQRAEAQARAFLMTIPIEGTLGEYDFAFRQLTQLLLDTEAACLEEAIEIVKREESVYAYHAAPQHAVPQIIKRLEQQAAARRVG